MPISSVALSNTFNEFRTTVNDVITTVNVGFGASAGTGTGLTSGRVVLAGTSGAIVDDSALTYDVTTDILTLAGTTDATSSTTGTLKVAGGLGVAKKLYVGTDINISDSNFLNVGRIKSYSNSTGGYILQNDNSRLYLGANNSYPLSISVGTGVVASNVDISTHLTVTGNATITGDLIVNGTTTTINSTTLTVDDINIELGSIASPTDVTAVGGGITLKGATDKTISWSAANGWTSSEIFNIATGKTYKIAGTDVLSSTTLGTGVTGSSLTSVGTIATGVWQGTRIGTVYGGTNLTSFTSGGVIYASNTSALATGSVLNFDGTYLGIGATATSAAKTTIVNTSAGNTTIALSLQNASANVGSETVLELVATNTGTGIRSAQITAINTDGSTGTNMVFKISNGAFPAEVMRIGSTGNLGIGTNNPTAKLHVVGGLTVTGNTVYTSTGAIKIPSGTTAESAGYTTVGMIRFNTTSNSLEVYKSTGWASAGGAGTASVGLAYFLAYGNL